MNEVDKQMKDVEDRIVSHLTQAIEDQGFSLNNQLTGLEQRVQAAEVSAGRSTTSDKR